MMARLLVLFIVIGMITSCEKDPDIRYQALLDAEFVIPTNLNTLETHYFTIENVPTFFFQNAQLHNVDTSSILDIKAAKGLLRATFNDADYDFIERIVVNVYSNKNPRKKEMYYLDFVPLSTDKELRMLSSTTNLKGTLDSELVTIEVGIKLRRYAPGNIRSKLEFGYAVF